MVNFIRYFLIDKKWKLPAIFIVFGIVGLGYVISNPLLFHFCTNVYQFGKDIGCSDDIIDNIGIPLFSFSLWILLATFFAFFTKKEVFNSWVILSILLLPVLGLLIALTPTAHYRMGIDFFPYFREDAARDAGKFFVGISLLLIVWKYFSTRRSGQV